MATRKPMNFSWIDEGKLAAFGRPSSPENLRFLLENNIAYLITLSPECTPPVFTFPDIHWYEIKVREFHPPRNDQIKKFISICEKSLEQGKAVGVHCRMGRGRTGVMAACYLVKFHNMTPQSAMGQVRKMRPGSIETYCQEEAVMDYYYSICIERQKQLNAKDSSLNSLNSKIEASISDPNEYDKEINESEEFSESIVKSRIKIKKQIKLLEEKTVTSMQSTVSFSNTPTIKLPEIPLPKFSGRYEEWNNFKLQFNNLITSNSQLPQEQKLHYLNSSLTGPAKDLQSIDDTFVLLFEALTDRFENKRLLVELHINEILEAGKLTTESAKDLRNLTDNIKKSIRGLKVLEYNKNNLSDVLILKIVIKKRAQILENINKNAAVKPKPFLDRYGKPKTIFVKPNKVERPCAMCKLNHPIFKREACMKLTVDQRNQFAIRNKLCLNCLSDQHFIKFCNSKSTCKECGCRHNTLLHRNGNTVHRNLPNAVSVEKAASSQELNPNAGGNETKVKSILRATILNGSGSYRTSLDFLVVPKITDFLPIVTYNLENATIPDNLADPQFATPGKIDILIGAQSFFDIIKNDQIRSPNSGLVFRNTVFGYVASGAVNSTIPVQYCGFISQVQSIDDCLRKFWEVETINEPAKMLSEEEEFCEHHYKTTHKRDETGRYIVQMKVKDIEKLGESKTMAIKRLDQLWKRISRDEGMKNLYQDFMQEYLDLDQMEKVNDVKSASPLCYYLPHHGVFRPEKTTTKLRVVFSASSPTTSGSSLNDHLLKGLVKEDIFEIMTRFRKHKFAFTTDIQKMYRQILIDPAQRDLLRIIWKDREDADPTEFRLKTVTYGTASAPFLAIRTLKQLALDESSRFPLASDVTQQDAYMDGIVSGASDLDTAKELQSQLHIMLKAGGMTLPKWSSSSKELWNSCASNDQEHQFLSTTEPSVKTLGITWKPTEDTFTFKVPIIEKASCTKGDVLIVIARLYDLLGFIGPVITKAKMFLQKLWQLKVNWDGELPEPLAKQWTHFVGSLKFIEELHIDRFLLADAIKKTILVGFADDSQAAYGAVVYMKSISETSSVVMKLIASKSRIAPIKTISIPRLELSVCLLLSQLVEKIIDALKMKIDDVILHTDSTIALAWINTPPNQLKTFIGNRVSKIQDLTESCKWRHISPHLNPADVISRGTDPQELAKLTLWWRGPQTSQDDSLEIPVQNIDVSSDKLYLSELKNLTNCSLISTVDSSFLDNLLNVSNNFCKLIGIVAFIFRFFNNWRSTSRCLGPLTLKELQLAKLTLVKLVQLTCFRVEIKSLEKGEIVSKGQAIHLETVTDLTADAMIATLKRFFSRRGTSSSICTDNATNFEGANSDLKRLQSMFSRPPEPLASYLTNEQVTWTFIPPRSPNFGGLWEAGVKSFKQHLKRTVGNSRLTIEQF
ncbi:Dual specificity protein phosphatase 23 [Araneus ventricosus]|uniref:Dual specificity protein phosphatase 23 n=1 Tax=Araneus ventricosus TaxID=182803 RepID=A0A4Y2SUL3_ARAVE|nr:Dual specificity protein phosphatase 23 [Araneus ventricosus]